MPTYTVHFYTEADWTHRGFEAVTPEAALNQARQYADDAIWELNFEAYDNTSNIERIEVFDPKGHPVAKWQDPALMVRLAAADLLNALEQAVAALNTAVRFPVPSLLSDSYRIAAVCDAAIAKARGGAK